MFDLNFDLHFLSLMSAALLTLLLMPLVMRLAHKVGAVDQPNERKVHQQVTPRMGGLGFLLTLLILPLTLLPLDSTMIGFLGGLIIIGATGIADDLYEISPRWKFLGIIIGSALFLILSGSEVTHMGNLFGLGEIELEWLALPITLFFMVGVINALNLSDGLDGLAAGIALISALFMIALAHLSHNTTALTLAIMLCGALIGFLYFNSHPARVFMGDTGSLILGFVLTAIALLLINGKGDEVPPINITFLFGLPMLDAVYVMTRRAVRGIGPFTPDKTHFHHRLLNAGVTHAGTVSIIYGWVFAYGVVALLITDMADWGQFLILFALTLAAYLMLTLLDRIDMTSITNHNSDTAETHSHPLFYRLTQWLGKSIPLVTWLLPLSLIPPVLTIETESSELLAQLVALILFMVLILYPWRSSHDSSWAEGLIYLQVFALVLVVDHATSESMRDYLGVITVILAIWVVLKLWFKRHTRIFLTTGLESLLLLFSWVAPWVAGQMHLITAEMQERIYMICAQAIVFLLAAKIVTRRQPRRNNAFILALLILSTLTLFKLVS